MADGGMVAAPGARVTRAPTSGGFLPSGDRPSGMEPVSLGVPEPILDLLPQDGESSAQDMQRAVEGWEQRVNRHLADADDEAAAVAGVVDVIERLEDRIETYDGFVPELRAWGQSPIYAMAWRDLYADLVQQLYEHEDLGESLDRERNYRLVEDGIRYED